MSILIAGGSGFIGTRLVHRLLQSGKTVWIFDKVVSKEFPELTILGDVRDRDAFVAAASGVDAIYNLAAEHRDDVRPISLYDEVNVGGAANCVAAAQEGGAGVIVFTSTVAVYPLSDDIQDETAVPAPFNDYGRTKLEAEKIFQAWQSADPGRSLAILRPTVVFGEGNRGNVYNLVHQIARGRFIMIGAGRNRKALAYVENVAAALEFALGLGPGCHVFNYTDHPDYDMATLVREIRVILGQRPDIWLRLPGGLGRLAGLSCDLVTRLTGKTLPISSVRVKKFCANTRYSSDKIREGGFEASVELTQALRNTIEAEFMNDGSL